MLNLKGISIKNRNYEEGRANVLAPLLCLKNGWQDARLCFAF